MKKLIGVITLLFISACAVGSDDNGQPAQVNLVKLLTSGKDFTGRTVGVVGYYCRVGQWQGLYLNRADCDEGSGGLHEFAIQLFVPDNLQSPLERRIGEPVLVIGKFGSWEGVVALHTPFTWGRLSVKEVHVP